MAGTHIYKDAEGFAADEAATLRLLVCANGPAVQALGGISGVVLVRRSAGPAAYRQMLARALAACGSVPVAELSAAFEALTCVQQLRKECSARGQKPSRWKSPFLPAAGLTGSSAARWTPTGSAIMPPQSR